MIKFAISTAILAFACNASAITLLYQQDNGDTGVGDGGHYSTAFYGDLETVGGKGGRQAVRITAEGKEADFNGLLFIDCKTPENSTWLEVAPDSWIEGKNTEPQNNVPARAIAGARRLAGCGN